MNWLSLMLIGLGGAAGSIARALAAWWIPSGRLPWGTLCVNVLGALAIGVLMARMSVSTETNARLYQVAVVGFCGGFTTFSAFSWQTVEQLQRGHTLAAAANVVLSVVGCVAATWLGWRLAR